MRFYLATGNRGKLREFTQILAPLGHEVGPFDGYREPEESDRSYAENAALKAHALAGQLREAGVAAAVLADDSGIELAALDGAPGVLSARFCGPEATWDQRRAAVIAAADRTGRRGARFVCALHFAGAGGEEHAVEASVEGEVPHGERGDGGFSYDAVFLYPAAGRTFAEITEEEKNRVSHRARAIEKLLAKITAQSR
jgi:XTP/dITP diphosphohydrolase